MDAPSCPPAASSSSSSMALVLGNPDLLADILIRVGSPTWLVRAALASKTWLRVSSDRDFLCRFRELHPPRVLGISVSDRISKSTFLLPVPQPPELAVAGRTYDSICRQAELPLPPEAAARFQDWTALKYPLRKGECIDYRNGRMLVKLTGVAGRGRLSSQWNAHDTSYAVASLLNQDQKIILPRPPSLHNTDYPVSRGFSLDKFLLMEDDAISCLYLNMWDFDSGVANACFSILRSGVWGVPQSAVTDVLQQGTERIGSIVLSRGRLYML